MRGLSTPKRVARLAVGPLPCLSVMWRDGFFDRLNNLIYKYFIIRLFLYLKIRMYNYAIYWNFGAKRRSGPKHPDLALGRESRTAEHKVDHGD